MQRGPIGTSEPILLACCFTTSITILIFFVILAFSETNHFVVKASCTKQETSQFGEVLPNVHGWFMAVLRIQFFPRRHCKFVCFKVNDMSLEEIFLNSSACWWWYWYKGHTGLFLCMVSLVCCFWSLQFYLANAKLFVLPKIRVEKPEFSGFDRENHNHSPVRT